jgi:hypothetical protein
MNNPANICIHTKKETKWNDVHSSNAPVLA